MFTLSGNHVCRALQMTTVTGRLSRMDSWEVIILQKQARVRELLLWGNSPPRPVLHPLHAALSLAEAEQLSNTRRSTQSLDELFVGQNLVICIHTDIKHHVYEKRKHHV